MGPQGEKRLARQLDADPRLWTCPEYQRTWNATMGLGEITLRQCLGIMDAS